MKFSVPKWTSKTMYKPIFARGNPLRIAQTDGSLAASGVDLTFATHLAASSLSECQIKLVGYSETGH
ncbi:hypothetical protein V1291_004196 [Nitrobacteraceae bacterium AZCC 1564]